MLFTAAGSGTLKRFAELLNASNLPNQIITKVSIPIDSNLIYLIKTDLQHGFISKKYKFVLITDKDISGQRSSDKDLARMPSRRKKQLTHCNLKLVIMWFTNNMGLVSIWS